MKNIKQIIKFLNETFSLFFIIVGFLFYFIFLISFFSNYSLTYLKVKDLVGIPFGMGYEKIPISKFNSDFKKYGFNQKMIDLIEKDKTLKVIVNKEDFENLSGNYNPTLNVITFFGVENFKVDDIDTLLHESIHYLFFNNKELLETYREEIRNFRNKYKKELLSNNNDSNFFDKQLELLKSGDYQKLSEFHILEHINNLHSEYSLKGKKYTIENLDKKEMSFAQEIIAYHVINGRKDICRVFPKTANLLYNNCNEIIKK